MWQSAEQKHTADDEVKVKKNDAEWLRVCIEKGENKDQQGIYHIFLHQKVLSIDSVILQNSKYN